MASDLPVLERRPVTLLDLSLTIFAAAALAKVGITLVSGPTEDREELGRQLRWRHWR